MALPHVLRNIVAADGCVAADNHLRSGKRYVSVDNRNELKNKPLKRQRKATLAATESACHCDALEAKSWITGIEMRIYEVIIKPINKYVSIAGNIKTLKVYSSLHI